MRIKDIEPNTWYWVKDKPNMEDRRWSDVPCRWAWVGAVETTRIDRYGKVLPENSRTGQKAVEVEQWDVVDQTGRLLYSRHHLSADTVPTLQRYTERRGKDPAGPMFIAANLIGDPADLGMVMPYAGQDNNQSVEEAILALFYKAIASKVQSIEAQDAATALKFDVLTRMPDDLAEALGLTKSKFTAAEGKHNDWGDGIELDNKRVNALSAYLTGMGL
jgi:hypothetical protein